MYKLADNGYNVYFNDILIGSRGDLINGNSNLWNDTTVFQIPIDLISGQNILRFETKAKYRSGLSGYPLYMTNSDISPRLSNDMVVLGSRSISVTIGFMILSIFVCLLLFIIESKNSLLYIYAGISSIFIAIYCYDYLSSDFLPIDYLSYKKITMAGLFFGIGFYSYAISEYYQHKFLKVFGHLSIIGFSVIMVISNSLIQFKSLYTIYYFVLLLNISYWIILSIVKYKEKQTIIFLTGFILLLAYALSIVIIDILGGHSNLNSPIIYISIIGIMPLLLAYESYSDKDFRIHEADSQRKIAFIESVTDSLTGAWNTRYLMSLSGEELVDSVICVLDFDDFKKINDTHGHIAGDFVMTEITSIIKAKLQITDDFIRYGGDEFIIIFKDTTFEIAIECVSAIIKSVSLHSVDINSVKINITLSTGLFHIIEPLDIKELIDRADFQLYRAKANGKNQMAF
jgi:diguanylate cyclase (GGDEF)-like protein